MRKKTGKEIFTILQEMQTSDYYMIKGTAETPEVVMNKQEGLISLSGRSLPENPRIFYGPLKEWLREYAKNPAEKTKVVFDMEYFNTSSSKMILELLDIIRDFYNDPNKLEFEWHYMEDDEDMLEAGEDFASVADVKFNYFSY